MEIDINSRERWLYFAVEVRKSMRDRAFLNHLLNSIYSMGISCSMIYIELGIIFLEVIMYKMKLIVHGRH